MVLWSIICTSGVILKLKKTLFIMLLSFSLIFSLPAQASARYATGVFIAASSKTVTVYFDCNDMWADIPSTVFSRQLARTAVSLSAAAYDEENIVSSLESMG